MLSRLCLVTVAASMWCHFVLGIRMNGSMLSGPLVFSPDLCSAAPLFLQNKTSVPLLLTSRFPSHRGQLCCRVRQLFDAFVSFEQTRLNWMKTNSAVITAAEAATERLRCFQKVNKAVSKCQGVVLKVSSLEESKAVLVPFCCPR